MTRVAIIAAMEREVAPLVRGWKKGELSAGGRQFAKFETANAVVVIAGIGSKNAEEAARAILQLSRPEILISAGLAGALIRSLKAGSVFTPGVVVDATDGVEYRCVSDGNHVNGGMLVSSGEIAGVESKKELVNCFHGLVVDMEAAGVAKAARAGNVSFRSVKAISDEADFAMPPMEQFMTDTGEFQSGRFAFWAALRPWQWAKVAVLARNSQRAIAALCERLKNDLATSTPNEAVGTPSRTELSEVRN